MRQCAGVVKCFQVHSINDFSQYVNLKRRVLRQDLKVEREPAEIDRWEERRRAECQWVC